MGAEILMKWKEIFSQSSIFSDVFVWIGWALAKGLKVIVDAAESLTNEIYKLINFTSYAGMDKFFSNTDLRLLLGVLFAGAFIVLGITLIFQGDKERPKVMQNILIAVLVITALPSAMTMLNDVTIKAKDVILGEQGSTSDRIISDNVVDLLYLDSQGFDNYNVEDGRISSPSGKAVNGFSGQSVKNVKYIDIQEKVTDEIKGDLNSPGYFFNVIETNSNGVLQVKELKSNKFFGFDFTSWYYRYHVDYLVIFISLLATGIALFFVAYKAAKLIFDLAVHGFLAVIFSASDLTGGQRTKKVLQSIGSIYVVLILCVVMIKFFYLGQAYISANISNGFVKALALLFFAFAVIDGPNIVESILGIDVGLKSGFQSMATMFMASRMVTSATGSLARGAGKLAGAGAGVGVGAVAGAKNAVNNFKSETGNSSELHNNTSNNTKADSAAHQGGTNNLYGDAGAGSTGGNTGAEASSGTNNLTSPTQSPDNAENPLNSGSTPGTEQIMQADMAESATSASTAAAVTDQGEEKQRRDNPQNNLSADNAPEKAQREVSREMNAAQKNLDTGGSLSSQPTNKQPTNKQPTPKSQLNPHTITGATRQGYRTGKKISSSIGGGLGTVAGKAAKSINKKKTGIKGDDK